MAPRQGANGTFVFFLNMTAVVLIFYFLLIRPQRKERERQKQMIAAMNECRTTTQFMAGVSAQLKSKKSAVTQSSNYC